MAMHIRIPEEYRDLPEAQRLREAQAAFDAASARFIELYEAERLASEQLRLAQQSLKQAEAAFDAATGLPRPLELTEAVLVEVRSCFAPESQAEAIRLLEHECGRKLGLHRESDAAAVEPIRLAVVRLSAGDVERLRHYIDVAQRDWRDVLLRVQRGEEPPRGDG